MCITINTSDPKGLLSAIKAAIDDGSIKTWSYDADGDFTHTPPQWANRAWLQPKVGPGVLTLGLLGQNDVTMTKEIYGVYHGRFIECVLAHFDDRFSTAVATAGKQAVDNFKAA